MPTVYDDKGQGHSLGPEIGKGGEGTVHALAGSPETVVKIYNNGMPSVAQSKLTAMLANPPGKHASDVVWPSSLAKDQNGIAIGFFMSSLPKDSNKLHAILSPVARQRSGLTYSIGARLHIAGNLATAVENVHSSPDRAIGDINESNIYVTAQGLIRIIDTDSFQIQGFRCPVGKPEFTPPELQGISFSQVDRTADHDAFGLAVLIYMILSDGVHPYVGGHPANASDTIGERIHNHQYPTSVDPSSSPANLTITDRYRDLRSSLPTNIRQALAQAFNDRNEPRPTARTWKDLLEASKRGVTTCPAGHEKFAAPASCRECSPVQQQVAIPRATTSPRKPQPTIRQRTHIAGTGPTQRKPLTGTGPTMSISIQDKVRITLAAILLATILILIWIYTPALPLLLAGIFLLVVGVWFCNHLRNTLGTDIAAAVIWQEIKWLAEKTGHHTWRVICLLWQKLPNAWAKALAIVSIIAIAGIVILWYQLSTTQEELTKAQAPTETQVDEELQVPEAAAMPSRPGIATPPEQKDPEKEILESDMAQAINPTAAPAYLDTEEQVQKVPIIISEEPTPILNFSSYTDPSWHYTIPYPMEWVHSTELGITAFNSPNGDGSLEIFVTTSHPEQPLEQMVEQFKQEREFNQGITKFTWNQYQETQLYKGETKTHAFLEINFIGQRYVNGCLQKGLTRAFKSKYFPDQTSTGFAVTISECETGKLNASGQFDHILNGFDEKNHDWDIQIEIAKRANELTDGAEVTPLAPTQEQHPKPIPITPEFTIPTPRPTAAPQPAQTATPVPPPTPNPPDPQLYETYTDLSARYSIQHPDGWEVQKGQDKTVFTGENPVRGIMVVETYPILKSQSVGDLADTHMAKMLAQAPGWVEFSPRWAGAGTNSSGQFFALKFSRQVQESNCKEDGEVHIFRSKHAPKKLVGYAVTMSICEDSQGQLPQSKVAFLKSFTEN